MQTVSRFEANLLRLLYYFLRREPSERALPLVELRIEAPHCLSRTAVKLAEDALAKGSTFLLATRGGWRNERYMRGERSVEGRLWQRTPPEELGLSFSRHTMEFLIWITAVRPGDTDPSWKPDYGELTVGDLLFLFFAHEGLRDTPDVLGVDKMRGRPPYAEHALCWLAYPEDYAGFESQPNFTPWVSGLGACIVEALQPDLAARWIQVEGRKERMSNPNTMRGLGVSQQRVLTAFLDAAEQAGRRDLARFLLRTASHVLTSYAHPNMWIGGLHTAGLRLADRAAVYQSALAFVRIMDRLQGWNSWARSVGYWDEGYHAAQLWKADWDLLGGDALCERAHEIDRQTDPLRQG
jgi:hypothetical protein